MSKIVNYGRNLHERWTTTMISIIIKLIKNMPFSIGFRFYEFIYYEKNDQKKILSRSFCKLCVLVNLKNGCSVVTSTWNCNASENYNWPYHIQTNLIILSTEFARQFISIHFQFKMDWIHKIWSWAGFFTVRMWKY